LKFNSQTKASKSFKQFISENKGRLDISLQSSFKYLSTSQRKESFLSSDIVVETKTKGINANLIKKSNTGIPENDYILCYENKVIFEDEFSFLTNSAIRRNSTGISRMSLVWEKIRKFRKNDIPLDTELFLELSESNEITLIAHTNSSWTINQGTLTTNPGELETNERVTYAEILNFKTPDVIFEGKLSNKKEFANSLLTSNNKSINDAYRKHNFTDNFIKDLQNIFLESTLLNDELSGVVIKYNDGQNSIIIKTQNESYKKETLLESAIDVQDKVKAVTKNIKTIVLSEAITSISKNIKEQFNNISIEEKEAIQIQARKKLNNKMPGQKGVMFIGKFKDITEEQILTIKESQIKNDSVTIAIISDTSTKGTKAKRNNEINSLFESIEIINTNSTNINNIIKKSLNNINLVIKENETKGINV